MTATRARLAAGILAMVVLALFLPASLRGQGAGGKKQVCRDGQTSRPNRFVHDVTQVTFDVGDSELAVAVHFRKQFIAMMFEAAEIFLDCDDDQKTGIGGCELRVRTAVGSRFHPNSKKPEREDLPPPLEQLKCGYATLDSYLPSGGKEPQKLWVWRGRAAPPEIKGSVLMFRVPLSLINQNGRRYNRHVPVRVTVTGSCSESPIPLRHLVSDGGVGIVADGRSVDWSGGTRADDPGGELHRDAALLDITRVQVDHTPTTLEVGVWLDGTGFGTPRIQGQLDILDRDSITVSVEPLGGDYLGYRRHVIYSFSPRMNGKDYLAVSGRKFVEFSIKRPPAQNAFRVIVWSDAIRTDQIPDQGFFKIDMKAGGR